MGKVLNYVGRGIRNFVRRHKKGISLAGALVFGTSAALTCGIYKYITTPPKDFGRVGQYWHTYKEREKLKSIENNGALENKLNINRKDNGSSGGAYPDPNIIGIWPLTPDNGIKVVTSSGREIVTRYATWNYASLDEVPKTVINSVLSVEDADYLEHKGVNWNLRKIKGLFSPILGGRRVGGSGITEQVSKMMFTDFGKIKPRRSAMQKLRELRYAYYLDSVLGKEQVLEFYLNTTPLGDSCYGVKCAAMNYFGKELSNLTFPESLFLAAIIKNPGANPKNSGFEFQKRRYDMLCESLHDLERITEDQYKECKSADVIKMKPGLKRRRSPISDPSVFSALAYELENYDFDLVDNVVHQPNPGFGFTVYTTINDEMHDALGQAFVDGLKPNQEQVQLGAGAVLNSEAQIVAILGRTDYSTLSGAWSFRNLAVAGRRAAASSIKPFVYGSCYDQENSNITCKPGNVISDSKKGLRNPPHNFDGKYERRMYLAEALTSSNNVIAYKVCRRIGLRNVLPVIEAVGFDVAEYETVFRDCRNTALGSGRVTPLELAAAYRVFVKDDDGNFSAEYRKPTIIDRVDLWSFNYKVNLSATKVFRSANTVESVRISLDRLGNKIVGSKYEADIGFKTGTPNPTTHWYLGGVLDLDSVSYSIGFLAVAKPKVVPSKKNPKVLVKVYPNKLYASGVLGPVVKSFVDGVAPRKEMKPIDLYVPAVASLDSVCSNYNLASVELTLPSADNHDLETLGDILSACSSYFSANNENEKYGLFSYAAGRVWETLYSNEATSSPGSKTALLYYSSAINSYKTAVQEDSFSSLAEERIRDLKIKREQEANRIHAD